MKLSIGLIVYHPHTRFHYSKILTYLSYNYGSFSNISGFDFGGVSVGKFLINLGVRNVLDTKITWSGNMRVSGRLSVSLHYYNNVLNAVVD